MQKLFPMTMIVTVVMLIAVLAMQLLECKVLAIF